MLYLYNYDVDMEVAKGSCAIVHPVVCCVLVYEPSEHMSLGEPAVFLPAFSRYGAAKHCICADPA